MPTPIDQRQSAHIHAVQRHEIEGVGERGVVIDPRVQGIKVGNAIGARTATFGINDGRPHCQAGRVFGDPVVPVGPVNTGSGK